MKSALITGVTGQAGATLTKYLLEEKNYRVVGIKRRASTNTNERLTKLAILNHPNFELVEGDITDATSINSLFIKYKPDECYHYAAQSHVHTSFDQPHFTITTNINGTLNILESIRQFSPETRLYNASTSEQFGSNYSTIKNTFIHQYNDINQWKKYLYHHIPCEEITTKIQTEQTTFHPRSPYAAAKVAAHYLVQNYREAYNLHLSNGLNFNFEGPLRGEEFVTRKITKWIGQHYAFLSSKTPFFDKLHLGNIESFRDWSHCKDTVKAHWLMLQQDKPDDYIISSMETHSVKEFIKLAFSYIGVANWEDFIAINQKYFRPSEVEYLLGDSSKIRSLGWVPTISFDQLVREMVESDIKNYG